MPKKVKKPTGLRYWMERVLEECENVEADFGADPVHDLRVALRRCRSMADGLMAMDPDKGWKAMKKAGKPLFQSLGDLRDVQIMMEWIEKLHPSLPAAEQISPSVGNGGANSQESDPGDDAVTVADQDSGSPPAKDPVGHTLMEILKGRESEKKRAARAALAEFDRKQWKEWATSLPQRAARIRPGSAVFKHLALERWTAARELHVRALRNRSNIALHTLRIGIKRFRYIVENFLPAEHRAWSGDLKHMQDLLGEVHDLDVLWATALACHVFADEVSRKPWHARILKERTQRTDEYRKNTVGPGSLWDVWRAGLPQGKQVQDIGLQRMKLWARVLDPDFAHSERVARFALALYDGLRSMGLLGTQPAKDDAAADVRECLLVAALLHDVGKSKGNKGHHKESLELIKKQGAPLGWKAETVERAALVARFHAGALATRSHKALRDLLPDEQKITIQLAAILRLANALDAEHDGHIRSIRIEHAAFSRSRRANGFLKRTALGKNQAVVIEAEGYVATSATAQAIARERFSLETVLRRPVMLKAMHPGVRRRVA